MTRAKESEKQLEHDELSIDLSDLEIAELLRPMTAAGPRETILVDETDVVLLEEAASDPVLPTSSEAALQEELASLSWRRSTFPGAPPSRPQPARVAVAAEPTEADILAGLTTARMPHSMLGVAAAAAPAALPAAGPAPAPSTSRAAVSSSPAHFAAPFTPGAPFAPPAASAHLSLSPMVLGAPAPVTTLATTNDTAAPRQRPSVGWLFAAAMVGVLCTLGATRALRGTSLDAQARLDAQTRAAAAAAEACAAPASVTTLTSAPVTPPSAIVAPAVAASAPSASASASVSAFASATPAVASASAQRATAPARATAQPAPHVAAAPAPRPTTPAATAPTPPRKRALTPAEELAEAQLKASMR